MRRSNLAGEEMARLKEFYNKEIVPRMMKQFSYSSVMEVPKLTKVTVNIGAGEAVANPKALDAIVEDLTQITGQKPVLKSAGSD